MLQGAERTADPALRPPGFDLTSACVYAFKKGEHDGIRGRNIPVYLFSCEWLIKLHFPMSFLSVIQMIS